MHGADKPPRAVLTRLEAAELLGVCVATVDRLSREGFIPSSKITKRLVRFRREDLEAYLVACRQQIRAAAERGRQAMRRLRANETQA